MVGVMEGEVVGMTGVGAGTKRGITHRRRKTGGTTVEGEGKPSNDTLTKERKNDKVQVTCEMRQSGLVSFKRMNKLGLHQKQSKEQLSYIQVQLNLVNFAVFIFVDKNSQ